MTKSLALCLGAALAFTGAAPIYGQEPQGGTPALAFPAEPPAATPEAAPQPAPPQQAAPEVAPAQPPAMPDEYRLNLMIRGVIVALNQANATGNYSVLRDLGTPGFQSANNPAKLAEIFAPLRARNVDLAPVMFFNPKLTAAPAFQDGNVLRLTGFFPTVPEEVGFDLAFQADAGHWLLAGVEVNSAVNPGGERHAEATLQSPPATGSRNPGDGAAIPAAAGGGAGEAKPIRIDLSEHSQLPVKKPPLKKTKAVPAKAKAPPPAKKPEAGNKAEEGPPHAQSSNAKPSWQPQ